MGLRISDLGTLSLSWADLAAFVEHAPVGSAINRSRDPDWWVTPEIRFLRDMNFRLEVLVWQQTADGQKNRNQPKWQPLAADEHEAADVQREKYDLLPMDEMGKLLGWIKPE